MKKWKVYRYINRYNGKCYIGLTSKSMKRRSGKDMKTYLYVKNSKFAKAILKYGSDAFSLSILHIELSLKEARELEREEIRKHNSYLYGYNNNEGGTGNISKVWDNSDDICKMYKNKFTVTKIADIYSVSFGTIINILDSNGIKRRDSSGSNKTKVWDYEHDICDRYIFGETPKELSLYYGVHEGTIRNILKAKGVRIRGRSEAQLIRK